VAAATPPGRGGVAMVRISGAAALEIGRQMLDELPAPRLATLSAFRDSGGVTIDQGLALHFPAPNSYTGEDVLELHCHGSPVVVEALIARALALGARRALPGEFTQRAFLNDKLDLAQAEAVADLIDAGTAAAARAALRSMQGDFSAQVETLTNALAELRAWVEAAIDFPEEEIDFLADPALLNRLELVRAQFDAIAKAARQGRLLTEGIKVVIAGPPNAGKSSLLNALAGHDAAIVTEIPGTTRDLLRERIHLDGMPLHLVDTAGLRDSEDRVESEGIRRAQEEMGRADRVLFVVDASADPAGWTYFAARDHGRLPAGVPVTLVMNKNDLCPGSPTGYRDDDPGAPPRVWISAQTGAGLDALRWHLKQCMGFDGAEESGVLSARSRHLEALARSRRYLEAAVEQLGSVRRGELVAEELRSAQQALSEITGVYTTEDLLGRIFASFCIGK